MPNHVPGPSTVRPAVRSSGERKPPPVPSKMGVSGKPLMVWDCDCEAVALIDCDAVRDTLCDAVSVDEGVRVPLRVADWLRV